MDIKKIITGAVATIIIGGGTYTISQTDVVRNFSQDTGMSQQQAEDYVKNINKDDLVSYEKLGTDLINDGNSASSTASNIDCVNYRYEWESSTLPCEEGKSQLNEVGDSEVSLGEAYKKLGSDSATRSDISTAIERIDRLNYTYSYEIVSRVLDQSTITNLKQTNSYNKATLKAALESK